MDHPPRSVPHHELVAHGEPTQWILFLHGILGTGANWRSLARKVVAAVPDFGAVLVDLRGHGRSHRLGPSDPSGWTLAQVADDLRALPVPVVGALGHSFGGKVALTLHAKAPLERLILVDSNPGPRPTARGSETTLDVLEVLRALPKTFPDRAAFLTALQAAGQPLGIAQWLAMNLVREGDHLRFGPDLPGVQALLDDYFAQDLWPVLEPARAVVDVIVGGASSVLDADDRARLARNPSLRTHVVEGAGHWVHVDAPAAVEALVIEALRRPR